MGAGTGPPPRMGAVAVGAGSRGSRFAGSSGATCPHPSEPTSSRKAGRANEVRMSVGLRAMIAPRAWPPSSRSVTARQKMRCASRMTSWRSKGRPDRRPPCRPASGARGQAAAPRRAIVRDGRCRYRRCDPPKRTALRRHPVAKLTRQLQARVGVVEYVVLTRSRRDCRTALARGRASRSREARQQSAGGSRRTPAPGPCLFVAPHRQREQLVRMGQALEPLDGDEALHLAEPRAETSREIEVRLRGARMRPDLEDHGDESLFPRRRGGDLSAPATGLHIAKLAAGGLVVRKEGCHRYYRLASSEVAQALERSPPSSPRCERRRPVVSTGPSGALTSRARSARLQLPS